MPTTSDGIPLVAWLTIQHLAEDYVTAIEHDGRHATPIRKKLLSRLNRLQSKYGKRPSILAAKAEYVARDKTREFLFLAAYQTATVMNDVKNQTLIASSLAEMYLDDWGDEANGNRWLEVLASALNVFYDDCEEGVFRKLAARKSKD